ncbi:daptide-type RiPP [Rathayibacter rathayi]|nr:daptide-type RiPP [Rathayibacter rathayi]
MEKDDKFVFEELDAVDAPSAESFWNGMFVGVGFVGAMAALLT